MDNKLLYDHLFCHDIDYFHVRIVDMIRVGNNTEYQLEELLSRKERKWIWDLGSITPYGLYQDDGFYCKNKKCRNRYVCHRNLQLFILIFFVIFLVLLFNNIQFNGVDYTSLLLCAK